MKAAKFEVHVPFYFQPECIFVARIKKNTLPLFSNAADKD